MKTPHEPWTLAVTTGSTYAAAQSWAVQHLGAGAGRRALVIGSPPPEALSLLAAGWTVSFLDWRVPPVPLLGLDARQGDACALPWHDATFDAISTTCVWCHVGLGRYGDPVQGHAEDLFLGQCRRVCVPGARLVAMLGPVTPGASRIEQDDVHRVVSFDTVAETLARARWRLLAHRIWDEHRHGWTDPDTALGETGYPPRYYVCVAATAR